MRGWAIALLCVAAVALTWSVAWWPPVALPPAALALALLTVRRGIVSGVVVGFVVGFLLDAFGPAVGPWTLALPTTAVVVDQLHRETLTHHTPMSDAVIAAVASMAALTVAWLVTVTLSLLGPVALPVEPNVFVQRLILAGAEAGLVGLAYRATSKFLGLLLSRIVYARRPV
jgi:rod shape-determining protein MreD